MKNTKYLLVASFCLTLATNSLCSAQEMSEGAARQARIDAAQAQAQIQDAQEEEQAAVEVDGVDAPKVAVEENRIQQLENQEAQDQSGE